MLIILLAVERSQTVALDTRTVVVAEVRHEVVDVRTGDPTVALCDDHLGFPDHSTAWRAGAYLRPLSVSGPVSTAVPHALVAGDTEQAHLRTLEARSPRVPGGLSHAR